MENPYIICVPGFLSENHSKFANSLQTICKSKGYEISTLSWQSGSMEKLFAHALSGTAQGSLEGFLDPNPIRGAVRGVTNLLQNTTTWDNAAMETATAGMVLQHHIEEASRRYSKIALIGFSLGTRVICNFLMMPSSNDVLRTIHSITFCGAAIDSSHQPYVKKICQQQPNFKIRNLYSQSDWVLRLLYPIGKNWQNAAGLVGFENTKHVENILISAGHSDYSGLAEQVIQIARN